MTSKLTNEEQEFIEICKELGIDHFEGTNKFTWYGNKPITNGYFVTEVKYNGFEHNVTKFPINDFVKFLDKRYGHKEEIKK